MSYMQQQYPMQQQSIYGQQNRQTYQPSQLAWNSRIRPVSSIDEVKASVIDFDGSVFFFPDLANKRIYTKQINADGTAILNMYELKEIPIQQNIQVAQGDFITRKEFEEALTNLKNSLVQPQQPEAMNF